MPSIAERRQDAGPIGAGVDADAVRPLLDLRADRVAVDDDEAVIGVVEQERLADPAQVGLALLVERTPGRMPAWTNR